MNGVSRDGKGTRTISLIDQNSSWFSTTHRFRHEAMATIFEIFIFHEDSLYAEQAAYAAFEELDGLERELSRFYEHSDIARVGHLAVNQGLRLGLVSFDCLKTCLELHEQTGGAFDVTIGSLMDCWLNSDRTRRVPNPDAIAYARERTGMHLLELDEEHHMVRLKNAPIRIDLGGFGKGYALDRMAELLREWEISIALLHGGWSSVLALDAPPECEGWPITISEPEGGDELRRFVLKNRAFSGSGLRKGPHILDPRTGMPLKTMRAAWSSASTAARADALSTAFMVMSPEEIHAYCIAHPGTQGFLYDEPEDLFEYRHVQEFGSES